MKKLALFLLTVVALLPVAAAAFALMVATAQPARAGDTGTCYTIGDADARQYCIAKARGESGQCYAIQRADLRSLCLAEVRK